MSGKDQQQLRKLYTDYLGFQYELDRIERAAKSGRHTDKVRKARDEAWQAFQDAGGDWPTMHQPRPPPEPPSFCEGDAGPELEALQRQLGIEPTGVFDHPTRDALYDHIAANRLADQPWSLIQASLEPEPEVQARPRGRRFEVAAGGQPMCLRLPPQTSNWILALDAVKERTAVNAYNLALMSKLAYVRSQRDREKHFEGLQNVVRDDVPPTVEGDASASPKHSIIRRSNEGYSLRHLEDVETDTQGLVATCSEHVLIVIRGSEQNFEDWWGSNLNSSRLHYPEFAEWPAPRGIAEAHRGFLMAFKSVSAELEAIVDTAQQEHSRPVFVTGHSLGGAVAAFAAIHLARRHRGVPILLYTFGQPRIGDRQLADRAQELRLSYYRYVHEGDVVPSVPTSIVFNAGNHWSHFGAEVLVGPGYAMESSPGTEDYIETETKNEVQDRALGEIGRALAGRLIEHDMGKYVADAERELRNQLASQHTGLLRAPYSSVRISDRPTDKRELLRFMHRFRSRL